MCVKRVHPVEMPACLREVTVRLRVVPVQEVVTVLQLPR